MAKNLIPEICKMLGVELGEEFKVVSKEGNEQICNFTMAGLFEHDNKESGSYNKELLAEIVCNNAEIAKLPWKPKKEERCWYIITDPDCDNEESLIAVEDWWYGSFDEQIALKAGVVFRTREEAQKALPKVAAEMGVEYEL